MAKFKLPKEAGTTFFLALLIFFGFFIPITLVLGNQEIANQDIAFKLNLFKGLLFGGIIVLSLLYFTRYKWRGDSKYGDSFGLLSIGEKPSFKFFKNINAWRLTLLSFIAFAGIFLIANLLKTGGFTGSFVLPQQFSPGESLVFSTLLIPISEEVFALAITGILVLGLVLLSKKYNLSTSNFKGYYFGLIPLIMGIFAIIWHSTAYAGSDVALAVVFFFWILKTFLILATGFLGIGIAMHMMNNFFIDFGRLYSSNIVLGSTILIIIVLGALYFLTRRRKKNVG